MSGRIRHRGAQDGDQHWKDDRRTDSIASYEKSSKSHTLGYGIPNFVGIVAFVFSLNYAVSITENFLPDPRPITADQTVFSAGRAAKHLYDITKLGPRTVGSYANDISAVKTIFETLQNVQREANPDFDIEIDIQTESSGSLASMRSGLIDIGYTIAFNNITNVIAKLSSKKSKSKEYILVNAHFDTVPNTEGASDDTVSCAVMLETFRALSKSDPNVLQHGVIFLFNGAEEGPYAGSYTFIKDHKWGQLAKVVINLEAAGSGGREFVFQTGPGHPWILDTYAKAAKYPYASVVAQEVFQAGIVPSDTDFRVFVNYGGLVGIDMAFINNGYIYHTKYDSANQIPLGSIQRAGENVLGVLNLMTVSPYLENPEEYRHGKSVFFDVLGSFIIRYPQRLHVLMNNITCVLVVLYFLQRLVRRKISSHKEHLGLRHSSDVMTLPSVIMASFIIVVSWIVAMLFALATAYLLLKLQLINVWYSAPKFGLLLFGCPALFGMILTHYLGNCLMRKVTHPSLPSFIHGHLLVHTAILYYLNTKGLMSSFILWFWVICPFVILAIGLDVLPFLPEKKSTGIFCLHILSSAFPSLITIYHCDTFFSFFGPLLGRTGSELPGDYVIAALSGFVVVVIFTYYMNIYQHANNMRRFLVFTAIFATLPCLYVVSGRMQAYSAADPITPKRLFQVHMQRTFYDSKKTQLREDSGLWIQPTDYIGIRPIKTIPFYKDMIAHSCDGVYCGLPYDFPMRKMIRDPYFLPGPKLHHIKPLDTTIYTREQVTATKVRFNFDIPVDGYANMYLGERDGVVLSDWSLFKTDNGHIFKMDDYVNEGKEIHFTIYASGYYSSNWKFWIEFEIDSISNNGDLADIGIARHYFETPIARTEFLHQAQKSLPKWICDNSWSATYDHFTLA